MKVSNVRAALVAGDGARKKTVLLLVSTLVLCSQLCVAQPGYQGKKLSLQGSMLFMPALVNAGYQKAPGWLTFNTTGEATADYVLGKRTSLGLSYRYARTSNLNNYDESGISPDKVFSKSVGIHYRIYRKKFGNIAPLGKYVQLGAAMSLNEVRQASGKATPFTTYAIRLGAGRNKILFDRLILSYGWELAHTLTPEGLAGATYYYQDDVRTKAQYRLWRHDFLNLKVAIGLLAH